MCKGADGGVAPQCYQSFIPLQGEAVGLIETYGHGCGYYNRDKGQCLLIDR